ncbi:hypothetical protein AAG570_002639 [Ranatra chinensis]|uniref:Solute carrier organic anion transporter family member n=1 Tax=Ranatra chinensis TaxID=642074 RepID=A0ABD0YMB1_9HEMI
MAGENGTTAIEEKGLRNGGAEAEAEAEEGLGAVVARRPSRLSERDDEEGMECGLGTFKPAWIQLFASKQAFLATFCIAWVLQGMYYTYFVSVITTIEKLFSLQSKTTGFIMSATEIGQIGSSLLLTYYGGQGHRPKWIAWGMVLFALCSFTCSLPHFIFGQQMMSNYTSMAAPPDVCLPDNATSTSFNRCQDEYLVQQRIHSKIINLVLAIFFVSLLGVGMGQTAVYTLGIPYIDDNVASRESPLYFAITIGVRILGPALGFILGSLCTRLYVDLYADVQIKPTDPRWVGAWWLGLVLISSLLMLTSVAMFSFPKRLSTCRRTALEPALNRSSKQNPSLRDFPKAVRRLLKNDILMCRTASSVLHILPIAGLYTFLPKYLESQFRLAAHTANMVSGIGGILVMGLGIILSGVFILRVKPNARFVAAWIAFTAVIYACGMGILMFVGCPMNDFAGLNREGSLSASVSRFEQVCETNCSCNQSKFSPICGQDGRTYFSACHAGCTNHTLLEGNVEQPGGSGGVNNSLTAFLPSTAKVGYCELDCNNFVWYILLFSLFVFIHSTSEVGSMLLILRCVHPTDKAMALGLIQFAIGLFGNVPCPIVYGAVVDSACLVWDYACGKRGACKLYDENFFRKFYHGTTGAILLCAFLVDVVVWYKAGSINFVDEQVAVQVTEEELDPFTGVKSKSESNV